MLRHRPRMVIRSALRVTMAPENTSGYERDLGES
jgi:hypothetical protein